MCGMNRIYWDIDKISMLTDHLDASAHSHGMIQFFLCLEDELEIRVGKAGEKELVKRYAIQLDYYAKALGQLTGKTVKEKIVYSFTLGKEIMC